MTALGDPRLFPRHHLVTRRLGHDLRPYVLDDLTPTVAEHAVLNLSHILAQWDAWLSKYIDWTTCAFDRNVWAFRLLALVYSCQAGTPTVRALREEIELDVDARLDNLADMIRFYFVSVSHLSPSLLSHSQTNLRHPSPAKPHHPISPRSTTHGHPSNPSQADGNTSSAT